ncbi:hypothetical protein DPPLL_17740 [Desulfofustis limnaeus]|uniref:Secreted protein n=1 Tax=Desulfofustis limnaeus TaxID=2740163 RepID=A0ABN6M3C8_9BACT|nr:hypothetical protein DPPLL_17740 [Desulfofustis limnaeus]
MLRSGGVGDQIAVRLVALLGLVVAGMADGTGHLVRFVKLQRMAGKAGGGTRGGVGCCSIFFFLGAADDCEDNHGKNRQPDKAPNPRGSNLGNNLWETRRNNLSAARIDCRWNWKWLLEIDHDTPAFNSWWLNSACSTSR